MTTIDAAAVVAHSRGTIAVDDPRLSTVLDGVLGAVRGYCRWIIAPSTTEIITIDGPGTSIATLASLNVTAIDSVTEDGVVVDPSLYSWSAAGMLRRRPDPSYNSSSAWTDEFRGLTINLTHGYPTWPDDLALMLLDMIVRAVPAKPAMAKVKVHQVDLRRTEYFGPSATVTPLDEELAVWDRYRIDGWVS